MCAKELTHGITCAPQGQRASKYAACLAMFGIDPEERNRRYALLTLRDYVLQRRWAGWSGGRAGSQFSRQWCQHAAWLCETALSRVGV